MASIVPRLLSCIDIYGWRREEQSRGRALVELGLRRMSDMRTSPLKALVEEIQGKNLFASTTSH